MLTVLTVPELEQMDDSAHTSGGVRRLERARLAAGLDDRAPAAMAARWRARAKDRQWQVRTLVVAIRSMRAAGLRAGIVDHEAKTLEEALADLRAHREQHRQIVGQMRVWLGHARADYSAAVAQHLRAAALAADAANTNTAADTAAA